MRANKRNRRTINNKRVSNKVVWKLYDHYTLFISICEGTGALSIASITKQFGLDGNGNMVLPSFKWVGASENYTMIFSPFNTFREAHEWAAQYIQQLMERREEMWWAPAGQLRGKIMLEKPTERELETFEYTTLGSQFVNKIPVGLS
jgi:hypothetical protein